jgi:hypothetical protein
VCVCVCVCVCGTHLPTQLNVLASLLPHRRKQLQLNLLASLLPHRRKQLQPLLYYVTTIDFGQVTYEADIKNIVNEAGMAMLEYRALTDSVQSMFQTARMIVIKPKEVSE